jgi:uncharacterized coiled-coil protein SlyX
MLNLNQTLAKLANDGLDVKSKQIDGMAKQKENLALLINRLTEMKGQAPSRQDIREVKAWAEQFAPMAGLGSSDPKDDNNLGGKRIDYWKAGDHEGAWMMTPDKKEDKKNIDAFSDIIANVQRVMDSISDKISRYKVDADRLMMEANAAESGQASTLSDLKTLLQKMNG